MGLPEYLAARESLVLIGQPVITYILIVSFFPAAFSILHLLKKDKYYAYFIKCLYINAGLYILGFIFLIRYHIQIYDTVSIDYPGFLRQMVPVDSSRFIIPLWIESEKLYFWAMAAFIFALAVRKRKEIVSFTGIILSAFSII